MAEDRTAGGGEPIKNKEKKMSEAMKKWENFRPSKALWFWSCAGAAVLTIIVGFTWGGWVTGGSAEARAERAGEEAAAQLAASICVHRFMAAPDAGVKLAELKDADSWGRDDLVEDAGWVTFASMEEPVDGAADLCAEQLASAELPVAAAADDSAEPRDIKIAN